MSTLTKLLHVGPCGSADDVQALVTAITTIFGEDTSTKDGLGLLSGAFLALVDEMQLEGIFVPMSWLPLVRGMEECGRWTNPAHPHADDFVAALKGQPLIVILVAITALVGSRLAEFVVESPEEANPSVLLMLETMQHFIDAGMAELPAHETRH